MTATAPALALQRAVYAALAGDAVLIALLGGARIHDAPPRNAAPPYVHLGEMEALDASTATEAGAEIRFAVAAVSVQEGRSEALAIAGRVGALLHDADLTLEGHRLVQLRQLRMRTRTNDDKSRRRAELLFRAVTEPL